MKNNMMNDKILIHMRYKKRRVMILILLLFAVSFMTVGYSSNLSSLLESIGYVSLNSSVGDLEITSIDLVSSVNATSNNTNFYISSESTDDNSILVAEFDINYYRSQGSDITSIVYDVTIKNNSLIPKTLTTVSSSPTFESGSSTLNYKISGAYIGTTVLEPGDSIIVSLTFSLSESIRNINYTVSEIFKFEFSVISDDSFSLKPTLNTTSLEFTTNDELKKISIIIINNSAYDATYNFLISNTNFELVDSDGNALSSFSITAGSSSSVEVYLKISSNHFFVDISEVVSISLYTTSPSILNYDLGTLTVTVPASGVQDIVSDETIFEDTSVNFTEVSSSSGIYKNTVDGEVTYFYRGAVDNNYVSFAGYTWRIIKIDKYGTRIILDGAIDNSSAWGTNPGVNASLDDAISVLNYENSSVKTIVDEWYNTNLSSYSSTIVPSLFCLDTSYQTMASSGNGGVTVYYFGSYIRNGMDSDGYTPEFICDSEYVREYNIGLLSGDEVAFAGGLFNTSNYNYYLYNSSISDSWWTLSPSYYDSSLGTVGMLIVEGSTGKFYDWPNGSTIENSLLIRPVITLDTDKLSGGSGLVGDMYTFSS